MRYLTIDELLYINGKVLNNAKLLAGEQQIRDIAMLEAAVQRPQVSVFGADAYPTPEAKAAALLHSVTRNHPFADGNKRSATIAAIFFLQVNGLRVTWQPEDALHMILETAQGTLDAQDFAAWLPAEQCSPAPEADAARDMAAIDRLIEAHRWLLDELDRQ